MEKAHIIDGIDGDKKYSILKKAKLPCAKAILDLKVEGC